MKVKELVAELVKLDQEAEVWTHSYEPAGQVAQVRYIAGDGAGTTGPVVWLESESE